MAALKPRTHWYVLKLPLQGSHVTLTVANAIDVDSNGAHALSFFSSSPKHALNDGIDVVRSELEAVVDRQIPFENVTSYDILILCRSLHTTVSTWGRE